MKKTVLAILLSACMSVTATIPISVAAEPIFAESEGAGTSILQDITQIEEQLLENGTCVSNELYLQIEKYRALAKTAEGEELARLESLIETSNKLLEDYVEFTLSTADAESWIKKSDLLKIAIASVVGFFSMLHLDLSAELLTQMRSNTYLNSIYTPVNVNGMLESDTVAVLKAREVGAGFGEFANQGDGIERDNYFSLHNFRYVKTSDGTLAIFDRYDYSKHNNFGLIQDIPIRLMYEAQEMGLLVPYYVVIVDTPQAKMQEFTSDYLAFLDGEIHVYSEVDDGTCAVYGCENSRSVCAHVRGTDKGLCELCGSVLEYDFEESCSEEIPQDTRPMQRFANAISEFFMGVSVKVSTAWQKVVSIARSGFAACKNFARSAKSFLVSLVTRV